MPRREIARLDALPHVMPLLAQRAPRVPHLRVTARHDGGDVVAVSAAGTTAEEEVIGTGWPVHKAKVGGSSQLRYERSTEDAWETNAKELAGRVTAEARRIGAELILVAGDPVARSLLAQQLGTGLAARVTIIDHEIPADSAAAAQAANQVVASYVADRSRERFAHWQNQQAHGHGVAGLAATEGALRDGAVADLLLVDHPESTLTVVYRARPGGSGADHRRTGRAGRGRPGHRARGRGSGPGGRDDRRPALLRARSGPGARGRRLRAAARPGHGRRLAGDGRAASGGRAGHGR